MATTYYQPGVYIQEIDTPQVQIESAPTAIPAFIGYTQMAMATSPKDLVYVPTLITSLLDYVQYFGLGPGPEVTQISLDANNNFILADVDIKYKMYDAVRLFYLNGGGNAYVLSVGTFPVSSPSTTDFLGDGTPNIPGISALAKVQDVTLLVFPDNMLLGNNWGEIYSAALQQCDTVQSTFLIGDFYYNAELANGVLQNKYEYQTGTYNYTNEVLAFRGGLGMNNLNYGAMYGPWIDMLPSQPISYATIHTATVTAGGALVTSLANLTSNTQVQTAVYSLQNLLTDITNIQTATQDIITGTESTPSTLILASGGLSNLVPPPPALTALSDFYSYLKSLINQGTLTPSEGIEYIYYFTYSIAATIQNYLSGTVSPFPLASSLVQTLLNSTVNTTTPPGPGLIMSQFASLYTLIGESEIVVHANTAYLGTGGYTKQATNAGVPSTINGSWGTNPFTLTSAGTFTIPNYQVLSSTAPIWTALNNAQAVITAIDPIIGQIIVQYNSILSWTQATEANQEVTLASSFPVFQNIIQGVNNTPIPFPPSGAIAGLYAYVDNTIGVWKAPANVSVDGIIGPDWTFDSANYDDMNVDLNAGKSINAIRTFTGKGTLVWGARTLAGNDQNWRYVSVRRFFIMVEQAFKAALAAYVFEPNDANTWTTVIAEGTAYLNSLWRAGALMGSTPAQAFSVQCGLGTTMTASDILNGNMIVVIGMAVVRPAEFIILQFTQNVQAPSSNS